MKYNGYNADKLMLNGIQIRGRQNGSDIQDGIVTDGLKLWLDGRDFSNTDHNQWMSRVNTQQKTYYNLVTNGDFSDGTNNWQYLNNTVLSIVENNILRTTAPATASWYVVRCMQAINIVQGHKYYVWIKIRTKETDVSYFQIDAMDSSYQSAFSAHGNDNPIANVWHELSTVAEASIDGTMLVLGAHFSSNEDANNKTFDLKYAMLIDLTVLFGAGKDPTKQWCDDNLPFVVSEGNCAIGYEATPSGFAYTASSGSDNAGGIVFDGVDDKCDLGEHLNLTSAGTIMAMIKTLNLGNTWSCIAADGNFQNNLNGIVLYIRQTDNNLGFTIGNATNIEVCFGTTAINDGNWHLLCASWDSNMLRVYVDGLKQNDRLQTVIPTSINNFLIGCGKNADFNESYFFTGSIKSILAYDRALSDDEILQNYNALNMSLTGFANITSDFVGKISGSTTENPNICKIDQSNNALTIPSNFINETTTLGYEYLKMVDNGGITIHCETNGLIPQCLFAFNIVEIVERKYGKIPCSKQTQFLNANLFYNASADGVTITNNKNGSITISGTADSGQYPQSRFNLNLDKGTYYVGCFSDDNNLSYDRVFRVRIYASSSSWHEYTIGSSFTVTGSEYAIIALIQVDGGDTFNGTIWPIITKDSAAVKWEQFTVDSFAEKINWLKNNISAMRCDCWYGYGTSCPSGTEVYFSVYGTSWANYLKSGPMSSSAELLLSLYPAASAYIQSDGFIYFLAYSDACNGAVASTFYTDYISLTIAFK